MPSLLLWWFDRWQCSATSLKRPPRYRFAEGTTVRADALVRALRPARSDPKLLLSAPRDRLSAHRETRSVFVRSEDVAGPTPFKSI